MTRKKFDNMETTIYLVLDSDGGYHPIEKFRGDTVASKGVVDAELRHVAGDLKRVCASPEDLRALGVRLPNGIRRD
jgi:hypothetical protein